MEAEKRRKDLFVYLDKVLRLSDKKFETERAAQKLRLKWGRLIVQAIAVYGKLLEMEELEERIEKLEEIVKNGVVIPSEKHNPKAI